MEFKYEGRSLKGGVYKITNVQNGRTYYGSAKEFKRRWTQHAKALENNKHSNKFLQADFCKCGSDAFIFEVLEVIEGSKENRLIAEQKYRNEHAGNKGTCYNLRKDAVSCDGCWSKNPETTRRKHSEHMKRLWQSEDRRKSMSEKCSKKAKEQWQDPMIVEKMKRAMSKATLGKKRKPLPKETRQKIALKAKLNFSRRLLKEAERLGLSMEHFLSQPEIQKRLKLNERKLRDQHVYRQYFKEFP